MRFLTSLSTRPHCKVETDAQRAIRGTQSMAFALIKCNRNGLHQQSVRAFANRPYNQRETFFCT